MIENTFAKLKMLRQFNGDIAREIHAPLTVENDAELDLGELEESIRRNARGGNLGQHEHRIQ